MEPPLDPKPSPADENAGDSSTIGRSAVVLPAAPVEQA